MNKGIVGAVAFGIGAAVGAVTAWYLTKRTYEQYANEEIAEMKSYYNSKVDILKERENALIDTTKKYGELLAKSEYGSGIELANDDLFDNPKPYLISPNEFDTIDDYDTANLTYYADGVLTDDNDEIIDDVDFVVGEGFEQYFGEYEDYAVHIRNPKLKVDYEILLDERKYSDPNTIIDPRRREAEWDEMD